LIEHKRGVGKRFIQVAQQLRAIVADEEATTPRALSATKMVPRAVLP
jgi:hypothetical protein